MQSKGIIKWLAVLLGLASIWQLSFSFVTRHIEAEAAKQARINEATGQVARFEATYAEYIKFPTVTKQRMFYETMEEVLPDLKVIIESPDSELQTIYPVETFADFSKTTQQ